MKENLKKKNDVKDTMQIHSQAKVEFYGSYISRYLNILYLVDYIEQINIYDVFCGMGIYKDGHKGSPIVAFDIIKSLYKTYKKKKVHLTVNDIDVSRIEIVKNYVQKNNEPTQCCDVDFYSEPANKMLDKIKNIVSKSPSNTRSLIFIDPYGYKEIKKETIDSLMNNKKTEIILFLPISHMYRFTQYAVENEERVQYKPLSDFIKSFFTLDHPIVKNDKITVMDYITYIRDALSFNGKYYTTSYHIERNKNSYFALFFISSNLLGYEKILEAKWKLDTEDGNGFNLPKEPDLFSDFYKKEKENAMYKKLEKLITAYIVKERTNIDLYTFALNHEFLPKHAVQVLKDLQHDNRIIVNDYNFKSKRIRKGAFYIGYEYYKNNPKITIKLGK
jgi:three-Cys-motif partner protein